MSDFKIPPVRTRATVFEVSCLPQDHPLYKHFVVYLTRKPGHLWVVVDSISSVITRHLGKGGDWSNGRGLSLEEYERWKVEHYFDFATAEALAKEVAKTMRTWKGHTLADALTMHPLENVNE